MNSNRVTVRYAKALIELASERKVLDTIANDMRLVHTTLNDFDGFAEFIKNPGNGSHDKFKKVAQVFENEIHKLSLSFLKMVFTNNREEYLKDLCRNIIEMAKDLSGVVTANISSAIALDTKIIDQIKSKFEKQLDKELELTSEVNPEHIGGFVFSIDGQQYDASIASKLKSIQKQLQLK